MEIEKKKMFHHQGSLTSRVVSQSGLRQLKKKIFKLKKKKVNYHNRIEFVIVAIHPIGGHGFSVFDANFGEFISGDG